MNGRHYAGGIFLLIVILVASSLLLFGKKVEVNAASTVLVNQPYIIHFSESLKEDSVKRGEVYLENDEGQRVDATIFLHENKKTISMTNTKPGNYVLHVEQNAFEKSKTRTTNQQINKSSLQS